MLRVPRTKRPSLSIPASMLVASARDRPRCASRDQRDQRAARNTAARRWRATAVENFESPLLPAPSAVRASERKVRRRRSGEAASFSAPANRFCKTHARVGSFGTGSFLRPSRPRPARIPVGMKISTSTRIENAATSCIRRKNRRQNVSISRSRARRACARQRSDSAQHAAVKP